MKSYWVLNGGEQRRRNQLGIEAPRGGHHWRDDRQRTTIDEGMVDFGEVVEGLDGGLKLSRQLVVGNVVKNLTKARAQTLLIIDYRLSIIDYLNIDY